MVIIVIQVMVVMKITMVVVMIVVGHKNTARKRNRRDDGK
jgi:hypothetical protein